MNLYEKTLENLNAETARKEKGLKAAQGRINEAEVLAAAIRQACGDDKYEITASGVVTVHESGEVNVRVLVMGKYDQVRAALFADLGLTIKREITGDVNSLVTSSIILDELETRIDMYQEPQTWPQVAA